MASLSWCNKEQCLRNLQSSAEALLQKKVVASLTELLHQEPWGLSWAAHSSSTGTGHQGPRWPRGQRSCKQRAPPVTERHSHCQGTNFRGQSNIQFSSLNSTLPGLGSEINTTTQLSRAGYWIKPLGPTMVYEKDSPKTFFFHFI